MADNQIALQSQQLTEQSAARRSQALMAQGQAVNQGLSSLVPAYQEAAHNTVELGLDEAKRQQAMEELQWTQQLHTTDMLGAQKRVAQAQASMAEAQAEKAKRDLLGPMVEPHDMSYEHMQEMKALGFTVDFQSGQPRVVKLTDQPQQEQAKQYVTTREQRHEAMPMELEKMRAGAEVQSAQIHAGAVARTEQMRASVEKEIAAMHAATTMAEAKLHAENAIQLEKMRAEAMLQATGGRETAALDVVRLKALGRKEAAINLMPEGAAKEQAKKDLKTEEDAITNRGGASEQEMLQQFNDLLQRTQARFQK